MVKIVIENLHGKELNVVDQSRTVLQHFHDHRIDWMQACGAKGRCTTCKIIIKEGNQALSPRTSAEERYAQIGALRNNERLACQVKTSGTIKVMVPNEYKLPHLSYSDPS